MVDEIFIGIVLLIVLSVLIVVGVLMIIKGIELEKKDGRGIQFQNSSPYAFGVGILFLILFIAIIVEIYAIFKIVALIMLG